MYNSVSWVVKFSHKAFFFDQKSTYHSRSGLKYVYEIKKFILSDKVKEEGAICDSEVCGYIAKRKLINFVNRISTAQTKKWA